MAKSNTDMPQPTEQELAYAKKVRLMMDSAPTLAEADLFLAQVFAVFRESREEIERIGLERIKKVLG